MPRRAAIVAGIAVAAVAVAAWLYPRALPFVALQQSLTRDVALARADSFFRAHCLTTPLARTAVRFQGDDSLRTFVELAGGGLDSLNALVRGDDVAPFTWSVRAFVPDDPREALVVFAPDGRIIGFSREARRSRRAARGERGFRPPTGGAGARHLDRRPPDRWKLVTSSYETKKISGRIDRSYTFERTDRRVGNAPIRTEVVIAGDTPARVRPLRRHPPVVPPALRRDAILERSACPARQSGHAAMTTIGIIALLRYSRERQVRWRQPMLVGSVIGALSLAAAVNGMPGSWFEYDTAMSPAVFTAIQVLGALLVGVSTTLLLAVTLAVAEAATRHAFPRHLDWWKLWRYRGTERWRPRSAGATPSPPSPSPTLQRSTS